MDTVLDPSAAPHVLAAKPSLAGLGREGLRAALAAIGVPDRQLKMRVGQLWSWMYVRGVTAFADMSDVSKELRATLADAYCLDRPPIVAEQVSVDGTRKWLLRLPIRGHEKRAPEIEAVYIPEEDRGTLCISSQVGCTLTCSFCHTGTQRLVRNLEPEEIVGQVLLARDRIGDWPGAASPQDGGLVPDGERKITNVVLMGMGEPLYNFDNVRDAMAVVGDGEGLALSRRRITLSTSGVVPEIPRWGEEAGTMLAISLHAVRDELRDQLVPINRKYPIAELMAACRNYPGPLQRAPHHLRVRDAEGRQRQPRRRQGAGEAAGGHPGQDQPDPVQSVARHAPRVLGLGADRALRGGREQGRLCEPRAHAARARHHGGLRAAQVGEPEAQRARAQGHGGRPTDEGDAMMRAVGRIILLPIAFVLAALTALFVVFSWARRRWCRR